MVDPKKVGIEEIKWVAHKYGSGYHGFWGNISFFTIEYGSMTDSRGTKRERPWHLKTILPIKKEVTEKWWFNSLENAQLMAWRAMSFWVLKHITLKEEER